jgi:hypothetical protein
LALISLFFGNLLALVLVALKVPGVILTESVSIFKAVLVYHVDLAMVFWMPLICAWLWLLHFRVSKKVRGGALCFTLIAFLLLIVSLVDINADVSLSNYFPLLQSPFFISALIFQLSAVTLIATAVSIKRNRNTLTQCLLQYAAWLWLLMVLSLISLWIIYQPSINSFLLHEQVLWSVGHIHQNVNSLVIAALWCVFLKTEMPMSLMRKVGWLLVLTCGLVFATQVFFTEQGYSPTLYTLQMSLISWLPLALAGFYLLTQKKLSLTWQFLR